MNKKKKKLIIIIAILVVLLALTVIQVVYVYRKCDDPVGGDGESFLKIGDFVFKKDVNENGVSSIYYMIANTGVSIPYYGPSNRYAFSYDEKYSVSIDENDGKSIIISSTNDETKIYEIAEFPQEIKRVELYKNLDFEDLYIKLVDGTIVCINFSDVVNDNNAYLMYGDSMTYNYLIEKNSLYSIKYDNKIEELKLTLAEYRDNDGNLIKTIDNRENRFEVIGKDKKGNYYTVTRDINALKQQEYKDNLETLDSNKWINAVNTCNTYKYQIKNRNFYLTVYNAKIDPNDKHIAVIITRKASNTGIQKYEIKFDKEIKEIIIGPGLISNGLSYTTIFYLLDDGTVEYTPIEYALGANFETKQYDRDIDVRSYGVIDSSITGVSKLGIATTDGNYTSECNAEMAYPGGVVTIGLKEDGTFYDFNLFLRNTEYYK